MKKDWRGGGFVVRAMVEGEGVDYKWGTVVAIEILINQGIVIHQTITLLCDQWCGTTKLLTWEGEGRGGGGLYYIDI